MSNIIRFLETLGQNAELRHAAKPSLYSAMNAQQIEADAQWAVLRGDHARLTAVMQARRDMVCLVMAPQAHAEEAVQLTGRLAEAV